MINVDMNQGNSSVIKFGGYDQLSLSDELKIFNVSERG
jgi:hypothetical protein